MGGWSTYVGPRWDSGILRITSHGRCWRPVASAPSYTGGGNDILRPRVDLDEVADRLERAVARIRATGADVLMATPADPKDAGLLSHLRARHGEH